MTEALERPPFDPAVARALDEFADVVVTDMSAADIQPIRDRARPFPDADLTRHGEFARAEMVAPGTGGRPDVPVVVYTAVASRRPSPAFVHLHGGGLVAGDADSDAPGMIELASATGCHFVTIEYRLAPEHPYPAASDDVMTVLDWLAGPDAPAGIDRERLILSGVSAGGGLAASAALRRRDEYGPQPAGLLLMCPMLDHRNDSFSGIQMEGAGSWDRRANAVGWAAYLASQSTGDEVPAYASAAVAQDLHGLPPMFIDVGSAETFRDECVALAEAVWSDGGDAELHVWPGGAHGFDFLAPWAPMSRTARDTRAAWLRRLLARI